MTKAFASQGDMSEKTISFTEVGEGLWAFTAEGDPNSGVIIGDDSVMIVEAQATPRLAHKVIEKVREVTDKPISHIALTHYHAVRVLGASAYGASQIVMSEKARAMVVERGQEDWDSEFQRFPRLFEGHESIPGLTWPTTTFKDKMTIFLGNRQVDLMHLGRAHTAGDIVIHVPDQNVMFTGDIVEYHSACYCGDGHFNDWGGTLDNIASFDVDAIAPGRGDALIGKEMVNAAIESTYRPAAKVAARGGTLKEAWDAVRAACDPKFADYATPDGEYRIEADWLIACDGAGSVTRQMMGLDFVGRIFEDNVLIADVVMDAEFPTERWFWFDPPFNRGQSALLHKQPDGVWRIDLQLGWDIDKEEEKKPENVIPRLKAMLSDLILAPNIAGADDFYAELLATHDGLSKAESDALNARLVLVLSNHIGNRDVLSKALKTAANQSTD